MPCKHINIADLPVHRNTKHPAYAFTRKDFIRRGEASETLVSIYEIPPGQSAFPYHYHLKDEETFFILRGEGMLKTPEGMQPVRPGDLLFFPAGDEGAHKLTNTSATEALVYIDFDAIHDLDVAIYPDSGKIGVWGKGVNRVYLLENNVNYYEGE